MTFVTQHGDVPLIIVDYSLLVDDSNGGVSPGVLLPYAYAATSPRRLPTVVSLTGLGVHLRHPRIIKSTLDVLASHDIAPLMQSVR